VVVRYSLAIRENRLLVEKQIANDEQRKAKS